MIFFKCQNDYLKHYERKHYEMFLSIFFLVTLESLITFKYN